MIAGVSDGSPRRKQVDNLLPQALERPAAKREAWQIVNKLKVMSQRVYVSPLHMALVYTGLGERDRALVWLERAYKDRSNFMSRLKVDPRFDPLRSDPRFQNLLRRMNLPK